MTPSARLLVLALALALGGCMGAVPAGSVLRPELSGHATGAATLKGTTQVLPFRARGVLSDEKLAFRRDDRPGEILQNGSVRWDEPPARMVERGLVRFLRHGGGTKILSADSRGLPEYWISGTVLRFEQVIAGGGAMVVEVELALIKAKEREVVMSGSYCATEALEGARSGAIVEAVERASVRVFAMFAADLARPEGASPRGGPC